MTSRGDLQALTTLGLCEAVAAAANLLYLTALPTVATHFDASPDDATYTVSVFLLCFGVGLLLGGRVQDRWGSLACLRAGLFILAIAGLFGFFSSSLQWVTIARALHGIGAGAALVGARAVALNLDRRQGTSIVLARLSLIVLAVSSSAAALSGVVAQRWGYHASFVLLFAGPLCLFFASTMLTNRFLGEASEFESERILPSIWNRNFASALLINCLVYSSYQVFVAAAPFVIVFQNGLSASVVAAGTTAMMGGYFAGTVLLASGRLPESRAGVFSACLFVQLALGGTLMLADNSDRLSPWLAYGAMTVVSFSQGILLPSLYSLAIPREHSKNGFASGVFYFAPLAASACAVQFMAFAPVSGWMPAAIFVGASAALCLLVFYLGNPSARGTVVPNGTQHKRLSGSTESDI